jgi:hypothetical protein
MEVGGGMPSLKLLCLVAFVLSVVGFSAGVVAWGGSGSSKDVGAVIDLGAPDGLPDLSQAPSCNIAQHFCLVRLASGELAALYTYDTHPVFRRGGCQVTWRPEDLSGGQRVSEFRSGCSGGTFDASGKRTFGPEPRDLDQFLVTVRIDPATQRQHVEVDTRVLLCTGPMSVAAIPCERAPGA